MGTLAAKEKEALRKVCIKFAKEWSKKANIASGADEKLVELLTNVLFDIAELLMEGQHMTKQDVALWAAQRLAEGNGLIDDQLIKCIAASVAYIASAPGTVRAGGAFGPPGAVVAAAWLLADAITPGGECYLYYLDRAGERQVEELKQRLDRSYREANEIKSRQLPWDDLQYSSAEVVLLFHEASCQE